MQVTLEAGHRHDPPGADLDGWGEPAGPGQSVQGVGMQTQALRRLADRDEVGSQPLRSRCGRLTPKEFFHT